MLACGKGEGGCVASGPATGSIAPSAVAAARRTADELLASRSSVMSARVRPFLSRVAVKCNRSPLSCASVPAGCCALSSAQTPT